MPSRPRSGAPRQTSSASAARPPNCGRTRTSPRPSAPGTRRCGSGWSRVPGRASCCGWSSGARRTSSTRRCRSRRRCGGRQRASTSTPPSTAWHGSHCGDWSPGCEQALLRRARSRCALCGRPVPVRMARRSVGWAGRRPCKPLTHTCFRGTHPESRGSARAYGTPHPRRAWPAERWATGVSAVSAARGSRGQRMAGGQGGDGSGVGARVPRSGAYNPGRAASRTWPADPWVRRRSG